MALLFVRRLVLEKKASSITRAERKDDKGSLAEHHLLIHPRWIGNSNGGILVMSTQPSFDARPSYGHHSIASNKQTYLGNSHL
mmetsp:Transcript_25517/g.54434  ORF Transcript_25517/g.54434 Transcript_25517/m.54434 type:complete len:83 (+) Transcript_25517:419-667(+)